MAFLGHLETVRDALRAQAIAAGREIKLAQIEGKTMRVIRGLEAAHKTAWGHFYDVDNRLWEARRRIAS